MSFDLDKALEILRIRKEAAKVVSDQKEKKRQAYSEALREKLWQERK